MSTTSLSSIAALAVTELERAYDVLRDLREDSPGVDQDLAIAQTHALVSIAASLYRLQAVPARLPFDPLDRDPADDHASPAEDWQSENEYDGRPYRWGRRADRD